MPESGEMPPSDGVDEDVQAFIHFLRFPDTTILEAFTFTYKGRQLTEKEARKFIAFVRTELPLESY